MFLLSKPTADDISRFLADRVADTISYSEIGATHFTAPAGYNIDHNRIKIGSGREDFERAKNALRAWKMFEMPWVELHRKKTPIEIGQNVAIVVSHYGFYSINGARIVYTFDEVGDEIEMERFGFAYGTLVDHGEIGEERFSVEFDRATEEVFYDLFAFSRPAALLAKIGYPITRGLQKEFARDSKTAMLRAVAGA